MNDRGGASAGAPPAATPGSAANGAASVAPPGLRQQPAGAGVAALDVGLQAALARELQELLSQHSVVSMDDLRCAAAAAPRCGRGTLYMQAAVHATALK